MVRNFGISIFSLIFIIFSNSLAYSKSGIRDDISACERGKGTACYSVYLAYKLGIRAKKNLPKAKRFLKKTKSALGAGCERNKADDCYELAQVFEGGKNIKRTRALYAKASKLYRAACTKNDLETCYQLANRYDPEVGGWISQYSDIKIDNKKAAGIFQKNCKRNHAVSCYRIAKKYYFGYTRSSPPDISSSIKFMAKSCSLKYKKACEVLCSRYKKNFRGLNFTRKNSSEYKAGIKSLLKKCNAGQKFECLALKRIKKSCRT